MNSEESSTGEQDWLRETLQSAVHHARRDNSEETLMRLARDSLLLNDYLRADAGREGGPSSAPTGHRIALAIPGSADRGRVADTARYKLEGYLHARSTTGSAVSPEPFVAGEDDKRLAVDVGDAAAPVATQGSRSLFADWATVASIFLLILILVLAAIR